MQRKLSALALSIIMLLSFVGCSNDTTSDSSSSIASIEDAISTIDYDSLVPEIIPNNAGATYMEGNFVNDTPYAITSYVLYYVDTETTEENSISCLSTVLAGETSPKLDVLAPASGDTADMEYQSLSLTLQTDDGAKYGVEYDYKLDEVADIFEITE